MEKRPRWDGDADGRLIDCIDWHRTRLGGLPDLGWPLKRTVVRRCEPERVAETELAGFMLAARWGGLRNVKDWLKRRRSKAWRDRLMAAMGVVRPQPDDVFGEWWPRVVDRDVAWLVNGVEGWQCPV